MKKYADLFKQTFREFSEDKAPRLGAALAYYTIFSIAPLLLIAVAIAGFVLGKDAVQGQLSQQLGGVFGKTTADALEEMIKSAAKPKSGIIATIIGVITLFLGASGVFGQLKAALNTIWNVEEPKSGGFFGMIKQRFLSMAMVLGTGFLLLVSLLVDTAISAAANRITSGSTAAIIQAIQLLLSLGIITGLFAAMFRYLPDIRVAWRDTWFGAAFTAVLFVLGKFALSLYIGKAAPGSSYGAAGALVVLLVWVYWSAQILFFGAEFTQVYARSHGSRKADGSKAKQRETRELARRPALLPAHAASSAATGGGGAAVKLIAGGAAGCLVGLLTGLLAGLIAAFKGLKKLATW